MPSLTHDLSYEECDAWRVALSLDWEVLLSKAGVGTNKDTLKNRWRNYDKSRRGESLPDRAVQLGKSVREQVLDALMAAEAKRPTRIGAAIMKLEEWARVGAVLVQDPELFLEQLEKLSEMARIVEESAANKRKAAELEAAMSAFRSPTPEPKKPRK
jgi:hypothetical protein